MENIVHRIQSKNDIEMSHNAVFVIKTTYQVDRFDWSKTDPKSYIHTHKIIKMFTKIEYTMPMS